MSKLLLRHLEKGQALLFVIVAMVIVLTVSISVATRAIVNVKTTAEEENSQKAFSAAEAGIEKYLKTNTGFSEDVGENASVVVAPVQVSGESLILNNGNPVLRDDGVDLWLSGYPNYASPLWSGNLDIFWGTKTDCSMAAIEVLLIQGLTVQTATITRSAYDPCGPRRNGNHFAKPSEIGGADYANSAQISVTNGLILRIIPIYANTNVKVQTAAGNPFPAQGTRIESVGTSGETKRKITVFQGYPKLPTEFFSHVIFSPVVP